MLRIALLFVYNIELRNLAADYGDRNQMVSNLYFV